MNEYKFFFGESLQKLMSGISCCTGESHSIKLQKEVLVKKVSGPEKIEIGQRVEYVITNYMIDEVYYNSQDVDESDKNKVKWKIEVYSDCDTTNPIINIDDCSLYPQFFEIEPDKLIIKKVLDTWSCCISVYPYIKTYTTVVRQVSSIDKFKILFSGRKEWGRLQTGFAREYTVLTDEELTDGLDWVGKANVDLMKFMNKNTIQGFYENGPFGVEAVLSDVDDIENKVLNNFYDGNGQKLSFGTNTETSKGLKNLDSFQEYWKKYLCVILSSAKKGELGAEDIEQEFEDKYIEKYYSRPNFSNKSEIYSYDYYGFMGGTQKIISDIEIVQYIHEDCRKVDYYKVKTKMYIQDWYGADWGDINGWESKLKGNIYSLNAFFWLQHHYGCQPFETEIIYESEDYIKGKNICE